MINNPLLWYFGTCSKLSGQLVKLKRVSLEAILLELIQLWYIVFCLVKPLKFMCIGSKLAIY